MSTRLYHDPEDDDLRSVARHLYLTKLTRLVLSPAKHSGTWSRLLNSTLLADRLTPPVRRGRCLVWSTRWQLVEKLSYVKTFYLLWRISAVLMLYQGQRTTLWASEA